MALGPEAFCLHHHPVTRDTAFEMAVSSVRFGAGVTHEVGMDLADMGVHRVLVVADPALSALAPVQIVLDSLQQNGVAFALYDRVRVEPNDASWQDAIANAAQSAYDGFVAVGVQNDSTVGGVASTVKVRDGEIAAFHRRVASLLQHQAHLRPPRGRLRQ